MSEQAFRKWIKWVVILLLARVKRPFGWASFLALNPVIKDLVDAHLRGSLKGSTNNNISSSNKSNNKPTQSDPNGVTNISQSNPNSVITSLTSSTPSILSDPAVSNTTSIANALTCVLLYYASVRSNVPKDYCSVYFLVLYYTELNPPSSLEVGPGVAPLFRLNLLSPRAKWLKLLYDNKEFLIYPAIYAQILSNYLTPTKLKLNHKYLSGAIKRYCLNPIWMNYSLSTTTITVNALAILGNYTLLNVGLASILACFYFKDRFLLEYYRVQFSLSTATVSDVAASFARFVVGKANGIANLIYVPNLLSMLLILLTLNVLTANKSKFFLKTYIKSVGFVSAFIALCFNVTTTDEDSPRRLSKDFFKSTNLYLLRLLMLSKWRITKANHPWFKRLSLRTWESLETALMCFGTYKILNLGDHVAAHPDLIRLRKLNSNYLIRTARAITEDGRDKSEGGQSI